MKSSEPSDIIACTPVVPSKSERPSSLSVVIIGAGFAGLSCAAALQEQNRHATKFYVTVLDASSRPPGSIQVVGDLKIPCLAKVHRELNLEFPLLSTEQDEYLISRQDLQRALYQKLLPDTVRCKFHVLGVRTRDDGLLDLDVREGETKPSYLGPFHLVIAADGVRSSFRTAVDCRIALVGDARWAPDRWWDFGFGRIARGANIALEDGLELAQLIGKQVDRKIDSHTVIDLGKFSAKAKRREIYQRRITFYVLVVALLVARYYKLSQ